MTIDGELSAIRAVARRLAAATHPPDARQQRAWAAALNNSVRGIANGVNYLRAEVAGQRRTVEVGDPTPYEGLDLRQAAEEFARRLIAVGYDIDGDTFHPGIAAEVDGFVAGIAASMPQRARTGRAHLSTQPDANAAGQARRDGKATSKKAALEAEPRTGGQRRAVLDAVAAVARNPQVVGLTDVEIQRTTGLNPNSARPRRVELVEGGWLEDSGRTRVHHGHEHVVWVLTGKAAHWLAGGRTEAAS